MEILETNELQAVEGGNTLGNFLITAGGIIVAVGTGGTAGVIAGVIITTVSFIGTL